jgi:prepilin peptidase CpaA
MWEDVRARRIPNVLSVAGMVVGAVVNAWYLGLPGLLTSVGGLAVMIASLLVPFALGGIGGGDVKMMGAVGAMLGSRLALVALLVGLLLGGLVMIVHLARIGRLAEKLAATGRMFWLAATERSLEPLRAPGTNSGAIALPYSVPLGLGTLSVACIARATGAL